MSVSIVVTGVFGDPWLSSLFGSAVGPSPAPYRFAAQGELRADGSVLARSYKRTGESRWSYHADGTRCACYPCPHGQDTTWHTVYYYQETQAVVPASAWRPYEHETPIPDETWFDARLDDGTWVKVL